MTAPRWRLDLFLPRGGWTTVALGDDTKALEAAGLRALPPSGKALAYRVRRARKQDYALLREGVYKPDPERPDEKIFWRR